MLAADTDKVPAFPGAEGHGRYVTGGRGGTVYHVTNLNDSGTGSLRWALSQSGAKTIVFDVSGYIDLKSQLDVSSNTTIAGQTAPDGGITLRYYTLYFGSCDNVIVRFIRSRRSQVKDVNDGADATWGRRKKNIIIDHCSFSWSIDEVASFYDNRDFSMQWCTIGEGLANPGHSKGAHSYGGIWGGKNASYHHNLLCHVQNRVPRINGARYEWDGYDKTKYDNTVDAERVDLRNNLYYNWGNGNGCYGGPGGGYCNIVNCYYKAGPGTKNKTRVLEASIGSSGNSTNEALHGMGSVYYINGNYVSANTSSPRNYDWNGLKMDTGHYRKSGSSIIKSNTVGQNYEYYVPDNKNYYVGLEHFTASDGTSVVAMKLAEPIDAGDITTHSAENAYSKILDYCGASLSRDAVDIRYMEEARTGTVHYNGDVAYTNASGKTFETSNTKGIVDFINDPSKDENKGVPSYPVLETVTRPTDFDEDGDGIPNAWEEANGLNPNDKTDGNLKTIDPRGWYTNLEVYANSLVEHIIKAQNQDAIEAVDEYYPEYKTSGIEEIYASSAGEVIEIQYFNLNGMRIAEPGDGITIRRLVFSDGHVETDKVIRTQL